MARVEPAAGSEVALIASRGAFSRKYALDWSAPPLGAGAFATVHKCTRRSDGAAFAVKVRRDDDDDDGDDDDADDDNDNDNDDDDDDDDADDENDVADDVADDADARRRSSAAARVARCGAAASPAARSHDRQSGAQSAAHARAIAERGRARMSRGGGGWGAASAVP